MSSETTAIVQRRLVGLTVLLVVAFLISLLLRAGSGAPDELPSVVIPLNGSNAAADPAAASLAPTLDAPEPTAELSPAEPSPTPTAQPAVRVTTAPKAAVVAPKPPSPVPKPAAASIAKPAKPAPEPSKPAAARRWVVIVGAYKDPMAAKAIANRIRLAGFKADTVPVTSAGERLNRVRAGPFSSKEEAESARVTLIVEGLTKAVLAVEK